MGKKNSSLAELVGGCWDDGTAGSSIVDRIGQLGRCARASPRRKRRSRLADTIIDGHFFFPLRAKQVERLSSAISHPPGQRRNGQVSYARVSPPLLFPPSSSCLPACLPAFLPFFLTLALSFPHPITSCSEATARRSRPEQVLKPCACGASAHTAWYTPLCYLVRSCIVRHVMCRSDGSMQGRPAWRAAGKTGGEERKRGAQPQCRHASTSPWVKRHFRRFNSVSRQQVMPAQHQSIHSSITTANRVFMNHCLLIRPGEAVSRLSSPFGRLRNKPPISPASSPL